MVLFHMSAGTANPAALAPPEAFYEQRTGSQQVSSLPPINEEGEEGEEEEGAAEQRLNELFRVPLKRILIHWPKTKPPLAWFHFSKA